MNNWLSNTLSDLVNQGLDQLGQLFFPQRGLSLAGLGSDQELNIDLVDLNPSIVKARCQEEASPASGLITDIDLCCNSNLVTQSNHGFSMPSYGFLPVTYNTSTNRWEVANATNESTLHDAFVTEIVDTSQFVITTSGVITVGNHGLLSGNYYFLKTGTTLIDVTPDNVYDDVLAFVIDSETIVLLSQRPITQEEDNVEDRIDGIIKTVNYDTATQKLVITSTLNTEFSTTIPLTGTASTAISGENGLSSALVSGITEISLGGTLDQDTTINLANFDLNFDTSTSGMINIDTLGGNGQFNIDGIIHLTSSTSHILLTSTSGTTTWRMEIDDTGTVTYTSV